MATGTAAAKAFNRKGREGPARSQSEYAGTPRYHFFASACGLFFANFAVKGFAKALNPCTTSIF
jgi:hypothetical protein